MMAETDYTWKPMKKYKRKKKNKNKEENTLKQIAKSQEEIKLLSLKVIEKTSVKEPTTTKATEKSLEEMKQLLLKVITDQSFDKDQFAAAAAEATTTEISLEEIKQLLLKLIADHQTSAGKEKEPAVAAAVDVYEMTNSLEEMNKSLTKVLAITSKIAADNQTFLQSASSSSTTTAEKYYSETKYTIIDCIKIINQLKTISWAGGHDGPDFMFVQFLKMFEDKVNIEIFMNLSDELRKRWINGVLLQMIMKK